MRTEIFIENERVDITNDISTLLTLALDDIKDFASRNTTFSKTIVLPGTARNNKLLGNIFKVTIGNPYDPDSENIGLNFNASVGAECKIFQDHIQVFKGVFRVMEVVHSNGVNEYECAVFGELTGLILSLGAKKIEELDFSAYDHVWNATNIIASWDNASGVGVYYPLIDVGDVSSDKVDYDVQALRPALFLREYLDKSFQAAGYSWQSNLFDSARFKKLVIPFNRKVFAALNTNLLERIAPSQSDTGIATYNIVWDPFAGTLGNFTTGDDITFSYAGTQPASATINASVVIEAFSLFPTVLQARLLKNGGIIKQVNVDSLGTVIDLTTTGVSITSGDTLSIRIVGIAGGDITVSGNLQVEADNAVPTNINIGDTVPMNGCIPQNILQKDLLSSVIKLFNLYVFEDRYKAKFLNIEPYIDFFNVSGITDWTYKMDRTKSQRIKPMSELNSRYYDFKFKQDNDYYNELYRARYNQVYGDYIFDSNFQFTNERTEVPLIFSGSPLLGYPGTDKIVTTIFKFNNSIEERIDFNIRILQTKKITGVASWDLMDGVSVLSAGLTTYGYGGHYDDPDAPANDIQFGVPRELFFTLVSGAVNVTQFNVYWSPYMAEITDKDSKLLTAYFKLNAKDIFDLDFSDFIYIDGALWRLNKIVDWNGIDVCQCELLKVILTEY